MIKKWIKEPTHNDNTWVYNGEHTLDWLSRSTLPRATACRDFFNYNLSKLPFEISKPLFHDLCNRYHSAFFEIILGRLLQEIGFNIQHEVELNNGKKPDFLINTQIGEIAIEATSPIFNSSIGIFYKRNNPLFKIIRDHTPDNWVVAIQRLPEIGFNDSKKEFKRFIKDKLSRIANPLPQPLVQINHEFKEGLLKLSLFYKRNRVNEIGFYPAISYFENSMSRIDHTLNEKKKQLKNIDIPVILAIQGSNTGTDIEDFDQILFGNSYDQFNRDRNIVDKGFEANGRFINSDKHSTFQAILAFNEVGFRQLNIPTLYLNASTDKKWAKIFDCFHIRYFDKDLNRILNIPAKNIEYLNNFNFVHV